MLISLRLRTIVMGCIFSLSLVPGAVLADSREELLQQIESLTKLVASLQQQLQERSNVTSVISRSETANFKANLQLGSRGADVKRLQTFLNQDTRTRIATSGFGSPGNETDYFGAKTRAAVIKFQELHRLDILVPVGLRSGNGFVGPSTRKHLNRLQSTDLADQRSVGTIVTTPQSRTNQAQTTHTVSPTPSTVAPTDTVLDALLFNQPYGGYDPSRIANLTEVDAFVPVGVSGGAQDQPLPQLGDVVVTEPILSGVSSYLVEPGDTIELRGYEITRLGTKVLLGQTEVSPIMSGEDLSVVIPESMPVGVTDIKVKNDLGQSQTLPLVITHPDKQMPIITSLRPEIVQPGATVTIRGMNFTEKNNQIRSGLGVVEHVPSIDGETVFYQVPTANQLFGNAESNEAGTREMKIYLHVFNENGITDTPGIFTLVY